MYTTRRGAREYDDGRREREGPHRLEHLPLEAMPGRREADDFFRDDDRVAARLLGKDEYEMLRREPPAALERGRKLGSGESFSAREHGRSDGEARSADAAALLEDLLAGSRGSTRQKAVRGRALLLFRLIGSFRGHAGWELGCTHDTNSFLPKRQCAADSE